jgi:uncharacterized protein (TIGR00661 family)
MFKESKLLIQNGVKILADTGYQGIQKIHTNSIIPIKKKSSVDSVEAIGDEVLMFPPILKDSVLDMENVPTKPTSILVYFSSQKEFPQSLEDVISICSKKTEVQFRIFLPLIVRNLEPGYVIPKNITLYKHGDENFMDILKNCSGIISTAGHTLLSEAMHLAIPVYAIPLAVYEQQMNAEVIDKNGFGIRSENINEETLAQFISKISQFRDAIKVDKTVLLKGNGREQITKYIESKYL